MDLPPLSIRQLAAILQRMATLGSPESLEWIRSPQNGHNIERQANPAYPSSLGVPHSRRPSGRDYGQIVPLEGRQQKGNDKDTIRC